MCLFSPHNIRFENVNNMSKIHTNIHAIKIYSKYFTFYRIEVRALNRENPGSNHLASVLSIQRCHSSLSLMNEWWIYEII